MELTLNNNDEILTIKFEQNVIFFGQNNIYKNNFINNLINAFNGKNKNCLINGNVIDLKDYNVININEESDFAKEFKFTKNNILKQLIYNDVVGKINEDKLIEYTNEIFDIIDNKVNKMLDRNINKGNANNLSFQIEIPDLNSIIDKFTNIYIDNILLNDVEITKSMKRKLLYQMYFFDIKNKKDKKTIMIIDNFDAYLNSDEIISFLNYINQISNENCHFILTSCQNIFEYINLSNFEIYKLNNKLMNLNDIDDAIKNYLMNREYKQSQYKNYVEFYDENENLISYDEINDIKLKIFNTYSTFVGKILNSNNIKIVTQKPKKISSDYIICSNNELKNLFVEISNKFID